MHVLTTRSTIVFMLLLLSSSSSFSASYNVVANGQELQDDDTPLECPVEDEERLYYNIDIYVEATSENCDEFDLVGIGELLQRLVNEVEADIPEYEETERMETIVCPRPASEQDLEARKLLFHPEFQQIETTAQPPTQPPRRRRRRKRRYTYKGSGRCRRCKTNNNDRRLGIHPWDSIITVFKAAHDTLEDIIEEDMLSFQQGRQLRRGDGVCRHFQIANDASKRVASTAASADSVLFTLQESASECNNLIVGQQVIEVAQDWLSVMQQLQELAAKQARKAKFQCNKARKKSSKKILKKRLKRANEVATKTAQSAEMSYDGIQDLVASYVCEDGNVGNNSTLLQWLDELSDELYERIPTELLSVYGDTTDPEGCTLEAIVGYVDIEAYQQFPPEDFIDDLDDCAALGL
jgi:hypothetical protein